MWQKFLTFLGMVGHAIMDFVSPLALSIATNGGAVLVQAAEDGVAAAEQPGLTGDQKKAAAVSAVIATLTSKGIPVVMNAVNGAIEAAVAKQTAVAATTQATVANATTAAAQAQPSVQ